MGTQRHIVSGRQISCVLSLESAPCQAREQLWGRSFIPCSGCLSSALRGGLGRDASLLIVHSTMAGASLGGPGSFLLASSPPCPQRLTSHFPFTIRTLWLGPEACTEEVAVQTRGPHLFVTGIQKCPGSPHPPHRHPHPSHKAPIKRRHNDGVTHPGPGPG